MYLEDKAATLSYTMLIRSCPFQVTLLEESWSELFLLCAIQWCLPFEKPSLFAITEYEVVSAESVALLNHLTLMYNRYKRFNVNPAEFACMKAILLFKPGTILTLSLGTWHAIISTSYL